MRTFDANKMLLMIILMEWVVNDPSTRQVVFSVGLVAFGAGMGIVAVVAAFCYLMFKRSRRS